MLMFTVAHEEHLDAKLLSREILQFELFLSAHDLA